MHFLKRHNAISHLINYNIDVTQNKFVWLALLWLKAKVLVTQSCLTPCDSMDCNSPGFSAHGIFQAITLEWVAISFSRSSSQPRDQTLVLSSALAGGFFTTDPLGKPFKLVWEMIKIYLNWTLNNCGCRYVNIFSKA